MEVAKNIISATEHLKYFMYCTQYILDTEISIDLTLHTQGTNLTLTSTVEIEPHTVELQKTSAAELGIRIMSTQRDPGVKVLNLVNKYIFNP